MEGVFIFAWVGLAIGVGYLADSRGRSFAGFFLLSLVTSPLIGLVVVLLRSNLHDEQQLRERERYEHERRLEDVRAIAQANPQAAASRSTAEELEKLLRLKEQGGLTHDEFEAQKRRLLA